MEWRWQDGGWYAPGGDHDLFIAGDGFDDEPDVAAVMRLLAAPDAFKRLAVEAVCAARTAALGWREGPAPAEWSLIELRIDIRGGLWVTVHEYETDEYSLWMVAFDDAGRPGQVRRRPWVPIEGDPTEAGTVVA